MKVSIIVPFYNVEPYFRRCLDSIVNQSHRDLEIILVDDCSPDNSLAIAKEYADKDDRITIIRHEKNLRQGGARNSALKIATGEYIWFIDSDDEIHGHAAVEELLMKAQRFDYPEIIYFQHYYINAKGMWFLPLPNGQQEDLYFNSNKNFKDYLDCHIFSSNLLNGSSSTNLYKREFLEKSCFRFPENSQIWEDGINFFSYFAADRLLLLSNVYYRYYYVPTSTTNRIKVDHHSWLLSYFNSMEVMHEYYKHNQLAMQSFSFSALALIWLNALIVDYLTLEELKLDEIQEILCDVYHYFQDFITEPVALMERLKADESSKILNKFLLNNKKSLIDILSIMAFENKLECSDIVMHFRLILKSQQVSFWQNIVPFAKKIVHHSTPFGLLKIILDKRGWQIDITKKLN